MEKLYYGDCSVCFSTIYDGDYAYEDGEILDETEGTKPEMSKEAEGFLEGLKPIE